MLYRMLLFLITTTTVVVLDLQTKATWFARSEMWTSLSPLLETIHHRNYGLLANIPAPPWFTISLSLVVLIGGIRFLYRSPARLDPFALLGLGLLLGGALGNLYDRIMLGYVRDWILVFQRSAINLADVAIAIGIFLIVWRFRSSESPTLTSAKENG